MKPLVRSLAILTLLTATAAASSQKTVTISGSVGLPGVVMNGLPGTCMSEPNGAYQAEVPVGFTGMVTPAREGFVFVPRRRQRELR